ncbi:MAG: hypothetical protein K6348_04765, partial [Deferribacterales bacterium]
LATDNPLDGNVIVSSNNTTKVDVLKFNVKVDNVNATFNSGTIKVKVAGSNFTNFTKDHVTALELWDGSNLVASAAPTGWDATNTGTSTWSNFTLPVAAGTTKTLTVKAVLAQVPSGYTNNGTGYLQIITGPTLTGIDANSNVVTVNGASVTGNKMYPFLVAPTFVYSGSDVKVTGSAPNGSPPHTNDVADASITFTVTANGGDIYIATTNTGITGIADNYTTASSSDAWSCNSPAETNTTNSNYWRIPSGSTATCTFTDHLTNTGAVEGGWFQAKINNIKWSTSTGGTIVDQTWGLTGLQTSQFYLGK